MSPFCLSLVAGVSYPIMPYQEWARGYRAFVDLLCSVVCSMSRVSAAQEIRVSGHSLVLLL